MADLALWFVRVLIPLGKASLESGVPAPLLLQFERLSVFRLEADAVRFRADVYLVQFGPTSQLLASIWGAVANRRCASSLGRTGASGWPASSIGRAGASGRPAPAIRRAWASTRHALKRPRVARTTCRRAQVRTARVHFQTGTSRLWVQNGTSVLAELFTLMVA